MSLRIILLDFVVFFTTWTIFRSLTIGVPTQGGDFVGMLVGAVSAELTMMWIRKRQARAAS